MKPNISLICQVVSLLSALVVLGAVLVWAPPCAGSLELANGNMVPMRCAYAGKAAVLLAVVLAVVCLAALATKKSATVAIVALSVALVVVTFNTPFSAGVCSAADMACQTTAVWLRVCGIVSAAAALVAFAADPTRKRVQV